MTRLEPHQSTTPGGMTVEPAQGPLNVSGSFPLRYSVMVYETRTGRRKLDLSYAYTDLSWNTPLDDTGKATVTLDLASASLTNENVRALTAPWRFALLIAARDRVMWFGPITPGRSYDGGDSVQILASELWAIFKARPLIGNYDTVGINGELPRDVTITAADLPSLAIKIVQRAVSMPGGALPLATPVPEEGDACSRTYEGSQLTSAAEALSKLSDAQGGPDIRFDGGFSADRSRALWGMRVG